MNFVVWLLHMLLVACNVGLDTVWGFSTPSTSVPCYLRPSRDQCHYKQTPDSPACTSSKTRLTLEKGVKELNRSIYSLEQQLIRLGVIPPDNACSELPPVDNGGLVYSDLNLAPGTIGKYICNEGYYLEAHYRRREFSCNEYGVWDGNVTTTPVTCVLTVDKCSLPSDILNGTVSLLDNDLEDLLPGDMVAYTCDDGYELSGSKHRVCLRTGNWSEEEPVCIRQRPEPEAVDSSSLIAGVSVSSVLAFVLIGMLGVLLGVIVKKCVSKKGASNRVRSQSLIVRDDDQARNITYQSGGRSHSVVNEQFGSKESDHSF